MSEMPGGDRRGCLAVPGRGGCPVFPMSRSGPRDETAVRRRPRGHALSPERCLLAGRQGQAIRGHGQGDRGCCRRVHHSRIGAGLEVHRFHGAGAAGRSSARFGWATGRMTVSCGCGPVAARCPRPGSPVLPPKGAHLKRQVIEWLVASGLPEQIHGPPQCIALPLEVYFAAMRLFGQYLGHVRVVGMRPGELVGGVPL